MIIKLLLKIWPALTPILIYCLWILAQKIAYRILTKKAGRIINATYQEVNPNRSNQKEDNKETQKVSHFSLQNRQFIIVLYLSFFIAIVCFLFFAIRVPRIEGGKYIPAHMENGKIIPSKITKNPVEGVN